ncbi:uncharacterized protein LOC135605078 [Musa acuminata AAA Group]|uniref:uncharacterized protein LOC135605078 n=1 Tax=Musa acuminata AAA Group TaxID=214697 RepID=UPI0031DDB35A
MPSATEATFQALDHTQELQILQHDTLHSVHAICRSTVADSCFCHPVRKQFGKMGTPFSESKPFRESSHEEVRSMTHLQDTLLHSHETRAIREVFHGIYEQLDMSHMDTCRS